MHFSRILTGRRWNYVVLSLHSDPEWFVSIAAIFLLSKKKQHLIPILFVSFIFSKLQKSPKDALNFDTEFTKEEPVLTPVPNDVIRCINQDEFAGFSFVNQNFGPERKIC